jgi:CDP-paratose 2-epimerase
MKSCLVTGSSGLIGSEVARYFHANGFRIHGIDNNQRAVFFGPQGDTRWNQRRQASTIPDFAHHEADIRDRAAHPRVDRAAAIPFDDFDTNAGGTLNLREAARQICPESPFIHMSSNKVYGNAPNRIALDELPARWDYADPMYLHDIAETFTIDQSKHSLFGACKVAADVMVQEYGRYFGLPICALRSGCLGAESLRRRAARVSLLSRQMQFRRRGIPHLWLQGQAGARQHSQLGRGAFYS